MSKEEANKAVILKLYDVIFNQHNLVAAHDFMTEDYIQHNPEIPTGRTAFINYFEGFFKQFPDFHVHIEKVFADGDYVIVYLNGKLGKGALGVAVVDIYRLENGLLAEHWDVMQKVPEESANANTMFNLK
jgi:predicted SnoaL-like aldol condensation-catalyzing enzyme